MSRFDYRFGKDFDKEKIIHSVSKYGIAVIEDFLEPKELEQLKNESEILLKKQNEKKVTKNETIIQKISLKSIDQKKFQEISSLMHNNFFNYVAKDFFGPYPFAPEQAYITYDKNEMAKNFQWHQDSITSIKFYFYLNDVTKKNGALKFDIGSHRKGFFRLMCKRMMGDYGGAFSIEEDEILNGEDIEATAGSLVIFNPSGTHAAGQIEHGLERFVIRFHFVASPTTSFVDRVTHKLWQTPLNVVRNQNVARDARYNKRHQSLDHHMAYHT